MADWIKGAIKHPGALRARLGIKAGERIPESALKEAERSRNRTEAREARLAETLRRFHHKGK